jgi:succinate-acetate transporter protein
MLLKSEKYINTMKQLLILVGYGIFMFCMIFFALTPDWGVILNVSTGWAPVWKLPIFLYLIIGESIFAVGPVFYLSYRAYHKFEDAQLKKKWKNFIYGFGAYMIFLYTIFISNLLDNSTFRTVAGVIGLICAIVGGYLMYIGVTRQLEK